MPGGSIQGILSTFSYIRIEGSHFLLFVFGPGT